MALAFFLITVLAGIPGFAGKAETLAWTAKILFFAGLIFTVDFLSAEQKNTPV
ncbi:DUF1328 domain-containing protein [Nitrosomonas sp. HPC101]|uniref:DUF1328 family protein n=1 Tax=Nitrosomonas sp. HPC101 TaxID=1658667 RepID=UPI00136BD88F|nr:DUF1328 family protein [Nitrosomonas sp. HPC101]MXS85198.1 DUF1328 domain-containing protein [Nitrosomonas sp. HPC101]